MYPLFCFTLFIVITIGTWVSNQIIHPSMAANQYNASSLIHDNYDQKQMKHIVDEGGGVVLFYETGQVKSMGGIQLWNRDTITMEEITEFISNAKEPTNQYKYSVAYDEKEKGWLVIGFPTPIRVQIIFTANRNSKEYIVSFIFYIVLTLSIAFILFLFAWCYAKTSSRNYSKPLKVLCHSVRQITKGDYKVKQEKTGIEEYESLQADIITLATQLEEEKKTTKQLEKSKRQMLLDISHDLRNPLATILGYSESLCREENLSEKERENYIEVIHRNSMRAHNLMNDLFEYTRLEEPSFPLKIQKVDICEFFREFVASYIPDMESANFEAEFDIPEEEWYALVDAKQMERALGNLVTNSLKYNKAGTKILFSLTQDEMNYIIQITDNGIGIESSLCDTIFLPFVRADKARNSKLGGNGLGLSITKKIIEAMGGTIEVESDCNQGCNFTIRLKK